MSSSIEIEINKLLKQKEDMYQIADELIKKWRSSELSYRDKESISFFLFYSGFYPSLIESIIFSLRRKSKIPWSTLMLFLESEKEKVDSKLIDLLFTGAKKEDQLEGMTLSTQFDDLDIRFKTTRKKFYTKWLNSFKEKRKELLSQAAIFHNDGLFEKEKEILKEVQLLSNEEAPNILNKFDKLSLRQAKEMLNKIKDRIRDSSHSKYRETSVNNEKLKEAENKIGNLLVQLSKEQPELSYHISIALTQMELFNFALKALSYSKKAPQSKWLRLELLLLTRQYISVIDLAQRLEVREKDNSESVFSTMYAKAKALWGLSQRTEAIQLLESILKVRPQYRSSHSLLMKWKERRDNKP